MFLNRAIKLFVKHFQRDCTTFLKFVEFYIQNVVWGFLNIKKRYFPGKPPELGVLGGTPKMTEKGSKTERLSFEIFRKNTKKRGFFQSFFLEFF